MVRFRPKPWQLGVSLWFALESVALGQPCGRPDLIAAFPDIGASGVPIDATLSAVYAETAEYLGESVELSGPDGTLALEASFNPAERRLAVMPGGLLPDSMYTVVWPELRGLGSASHGLGREVTFTTGNAADAGPPTFDGITDLSWDVRHDRDECTDDLEERFRFDFRLGPAVDDAASSELTLLLFQTSGPAAREEPRLIALERFAENGRAEIDLSVDDTTGHICFAAIARDLVGNVSASGHEESCANTTAPPFFYGCSLGARPGSGRLVGWALPVLFVLFRRRRPPRASA